MATFTNVTDMSMHLQCPTYCCCKWVFLLPHLCRSTNPSHLATRRSQWNTGRHKVLVELFGGIVLCSLDALPTVWNMTTLGHSPQIRLQSTTVRDILNNLNKSYNSDLSVLEFQYSYRAKQSSNQFEKKINLAGFILNWTYCTK